MKIKAYSPSTGSVISDTLIGISFGNVSAGEHCDVPVLIRPEVTTESNVLSMEIVLENDGGLTASEFGYYFSDEFTPIADPASTLASNFVKGEGVSVGITGGQSVDYLWLDIQPGASETGSTETINYRLDFEYN